MIDKAVSNELAVLDCVIIACPASKINLFPAKNSKAEPAGIGMSLARYIVSDAANFISAVICDEVVLANVKPITTVVVLDGAV
jgi:hypothetical protein